MNTETVTRVVIIEVVRHRTDQWLSLYQAKKPGERHYYLLLWQWEGVRLTLHVGFGEKVPFGPGRSGQ